MHLYACVRGRECREEKYIPLVGKYCFKVGRVSIGLHEVEVIQHGRKAPPSSLLPLTLTVLMHVVIKAILDHVMIIVVTVLNNLYWILLQEHQQK